MRERIRTKCRKFYMKRGVYLFTSAAAIICYLIDAVYASATGQVSAYAWIFLALVGLMQWAFLSGEINVQKMLFGAMFMAIVKEQIELMELNAAYAGYVIAEDVVLLVISVVAFGAHMAQQMNHTGKTPAIVVNQLMGILAFVFLFYTVLKLITAPSVFENYVFLFGYFCNFIMIICMETRVDAYKQIRTKALTEGTWTEENRQKAKKLFRLIEK